MTRPYLIPLTLYPDLETLTMIEYMTGGHYTDVEFPDDHTNVDCVLSWRQVGEGVAIDFRNGWIFSSDRCPENRDLVFNVRSSLRRNQAGKTWSQRFLGL
jgi:hypothetical protein